MWHVGQLYLISEKLRLRNMDGYNQRSNSVAGNAWANK